MRNDNLAVQVEGLTKSYQGRTVLSGLDLSVRRGTVFGCWAPTERERARLSSASWAPGGRIPALFRRAPIQTEEEHTALCRLNQLGLCKPGSDRHRT